MGAATPAAGTSMTSKSTAVLAVGGAAVVLLVAGLLFSFHLTSPDAATIAARVRASGALAPLVLITLLVAQAVVAPLPSPPTHPRRASEGRQLHVRRRGRRGRTHLADDADPPGARGRPGRAAARTARGQRLSLAGCQLTHHGVGLLQFPQWLRRSATAWWSRRTTSSSRRPTSSPTPASASRSMAITTRSRSASRRSSV